MIWLLVLAGFVLGLFAEWAHGRQGSGGGSDRSML